MKDKALTVRELMELLAGVRDDENTCIYLCVPGIEYVPIIGGIAVDGVFLLDQDTLTESDENG